MNRWIPELHARRGPIYLAIADALQEAISDGLLNPGDPLPSQRYLADFLGLHVNTINRAMREGKKRGLVSGKTRRGMLVLGR
jgi:GntR family transcriptional regulator